MPLRPMEFEADFFLFAEISPFEKPILIYKKEDPSLLLRQGPSIG